MPRIGLLSLNYIEQVNKQPREPKEPYNGEGQVLTANDVGKRIFRTTNDLHSEYSSFSPKDNSKRAAQLASRTLREIKPDGSFVIDSSRCVALTETFEARLNDSKWVVLKEDS